MKLSTSGKQDKCLGKIFLLVKAMNMLWMFLEFKVNCCRILRKNEMCSIQLVFVKSKNLFRCTVIELVLFPKTSYIVFRSNKTFTKTIVTDIFCENKFYTIVTLLYWMRFFLPVNAKISTQVLLIKLRFIFSP